MAGAATEVVGPAFSRNRLLTLSEVNFLAGSPCRLRCRGCRRRVRSCSVVAVGVRLLLGSILDGSQGLDILL